MKDTTRQSANDKALTIGYGDRAGEWATAQADHDA